MASENREAVSINTDARGIAILTLDAPGQSINTIGDEFSASFARAFERVEADESIRAAVIISAKKDNFIAGADVAMLGRIETPEDGETLARQAQEFLQRLADAKKPVVAAIHGSCLGGGLELALACHARLASDHKTTRLGLPEVKLGLIPGGGGTQRLPRLIGLQNALDLILTGRDVSSRRAAKLGMVDEVVPAPILRRAAIDLALSLADKAELEQSDSHDESAFERVVDRVSSSLGGVLSSRHLSRELQNLVLEDNPVGRKVLFEQAKKKLLEQTRGNYPAPEKALEAMRIGAADPAQGRAAEARSFGELLVTPQAEELINLFFATTALKKDTGVAGAEPREVGKIGVLGAGLMGAAIAQITGAKAGIPVRLIDRDHAAVGRGMAHIRDILDRGVAKKRLTARQGEEYLARISPTVEYTGFGDAQVVIEAVFEDLELKRKVLVEIEKCGPDEVIFASNTSTIPIAEIAEASAHPETVIGMHYFSPAEKMPLVEIVVTDKTAPWVTATCVELGKRQGKTVIVVGDGAGFYTSRILAPYLNEACQLLSEGVPIEAIDRASVDFGFPVGPLKLLDEVGLDVAHKASRVVLDAFGDRMEPPPGAEELIEDGRLGRKSGRGFYLYGGKKRTPDPAVYDLMGVESRPLESTAAARAIAHRLALLMVNEAAYCLSDGILHSARDGDIGAIFGLGFPAFRGGPFRYADSLGLSDLVREFDRLAREHGERFAPAPILVDMAKAGQRFYTARSVG